MKVLSYLEYSAMSNDNNLQEEYYWFIRHKFNNNEVGSIANVFFQPFKPELITELFECWTKDLWDVQLKSSYQGYFASPTQKIRLCNKKTYMEVALDDNWLDFFYPRTLDDFITDTQRAGIELSWRGGK